MEMIKGSKNLSLSLGFTLIEMMVAMTLFSVVIILNVSIISLVSNAQKKAIALQNAEDNIRFAFEAMAKEIRTGMTFYCSNGAVSGGTQDCLAGGSSFTFTNAYLDPNTNNIVNDRVTYQRFYNASSQTYQLVRSRTGSPPCPSGIVPGDNCLVITSSAVDVSSLVFIAAGSGTDGVQPRVTIIMQGKVKDVKNIGTATLNLQTTISQGKLDS